MKWSKSIHVLTGQTCFHIIMHFSIITLLIWGFKHRMLVDTSAGLVIAYMVLLVAMIVTQRIASLRKLGDFLEEASTTYYFGAAMMALYLIYQYLPNTFLIGIFAVCLLLGPALISLFSKAPATQTEKKRS